MVSSDYKPLSCNGHTTTDECGVAGTLCHTLKKQWYFEGGGGGMPICHYYYICHVNELMFTLIPAVTEALSTTVVDDCEVSDTLQEVSH